MKVHEIISESRLNEGYLGQTLGDEGPGILLKAQYKLRQLFGLDMATFLEKKAGKDNAAEKLVAYQIADKYEKGGILGIGARLDREAFTKLRSAADKYADELYDARINKFTEPRPVEAIVPPKQAATPGTPAKGRTQEPMLGNNGQPIIGADGKPAMKSVPGTPATPGTPAVPNDLFAQFPDARKDILQLAEAKYLDRIASQFGTTNPKKVAEKAAEAKEAKAAKVKSGNRFTVWGTVKGVIALVGGVYALLNLAILGKILSGPISTYKKTMDSAREYLGDTDNNAFQQLKDAGQLTGMSYQGREPENIEEWFVLYNRLQMQKAVAKMLEILSGSLLVSATGYGIFRVLGTFIPGVTQLTKIASPAAFNLIALEIAKDPNPSQVILTLVMHNPLLMSDGATELANWMQESEVANMPKYKDSFERYDKIVKNINAAIAKEAEASKAKDAESEKTDEPVPPGTATNQGAKAEVPAPSEPAVAQTPAVKRQYDYQGREINPDGSLK